MSVLYVRTVCPYYMSVLYVCLCLFAYTGRQLFPVVQTWIPLAVDVVDEMISLPFSEPFRASVDLDLYPVSVHGNNWYQLLMW